MAQKKLESSHYISSHKTSEHLPSLPSAQRKVPFLPSEQTEQPEFKISENIDERLFGSIEFAEKDQREFLHFPSSHGSLRRLRTISSPGVEGSLKHEVDMYMTPLKDGITRSYSPDGSEARDACLSDSERLNSVDHVKSKRKEPLFRSKSLEMFGVFGFTNAIEENTIVGNYYVGKLIARGTFSECHQGFHLGPLAKSSFGKKLRKKYSLDYSFEQIKTRANSLASLFNEKAPELEEYQKSSLAMKIVPLLPAKPDDPLFRNNITSDSFVELAEKFAIFNNEIRIWKQLHHENILPLLEVLEMPDPYASHGKSILSSRNSGSDFIDKQTLQNSLSLDSRAGVIKIVVSLLMVGGDLLGFINKAKSQKIGYNHKPSRRKPQETCERSNLSEPYKLARRASKPIPNENWFTGWNFSIKKELPTASLPVANYFDDFFTTDLSRFVPKEMTGGLDIRIIRDIMRQLCNAISYLHYEKRIIHKDIKLENILLDNLPSTVSQDSFDIKSLSRRDKLDSTIKVMICDFGLSEQLNSPYEDCSYLPSPLTRSFVFDEALEDAMDNIHTPQKVSCHLTTSCSCTCRTCFEFKTLNQNLGSGSLPLTQTITFSPPPPASAFCTGTLWYCPPEVINPETKHYFEKCRCDRELNAVKSDIWSLGVVFYALLTGELPFNEDYIPRLQLMVQKGEFERISLDNIWLFDESLDSSLYPRFFKEEMEKHVQLSNELLSHMLEVDIHKRWDIRQIMEHPWLQYD